MAFLFGNLTSQYFANIYLNELDYFIKHTIKNKTYVRYMDDFILILKTKDEAKQLKNTIFNFLKQELHLELNPKSRYYPSAMGVNFCGYRIFPTYRLLRNDSKKKIKKKIKKWNLLYKNGKLDFAKSFQSLKSWEGHISHCNSYRLKQKILNSCNFLYNTPNSNKKIEENFESLF